MDSENMRAMHWIVGRDTGLSSQHMWAVMMGVSPERPSEPHDPDDFGRCLRLLDAVPEWKGRLGEMRAQSPTWARLVANWEAITEAYNKERPTNRCPSAYKLIRACHGDD